MEWHLITEAFGKSVTHFLPHALLSFNKMLAEMGNTLLPPATVFSGFGGWGVVGGGFLFVWFGFFYVVGFFCWFFFWGGEAGVVVWVYVFVLFLF